MMSLKTECNKSPELRQKVIDLTLAGPFDSFNSNVGRAYQVEPDTGYWRHAFITGRICPPAGKK